MKKIPLRKKRKEPRDNDWRRNEYSVDQIEAWEAEGGNVGLRLEAGDVVLDIDPKNDPEGRTAIELLAVIEREFDLDFSDDVIVETGRLDPCPGYHVHMTKPEGVRTREKLKDRFGTGTAIEFKTVGRQVLAPGCRHPDGGTYRKIQGTERQPCPPALLEAITRPATKSADAGGGEVAHGQLAEALAQLPVEEFREYDVWRDLMFACHHGTGGSVEGREAFKTWSVSDPIHADAGGDIDYFWDAADAEYDEGITIHTLYWHLSQRDLGMSPGDPLVDFADLIEEARNTPQPYKPRWRWSAPDKDGNRKILASWTHNIREAMRALGFTFYRDDFSGNIYNEQTGALLDDDHLVYLGGAISDHYGTRWTADTTIIKRHEAVVLEAKDHHRHPIREYLEALVWDGKPRIETWLIDHAGAEATPYVRTVSKLFLLAAVARVYSPGCKFDLTLVLEGPQGIGKSSLIYRLGGKWHLEGIPPLRSAADKDVIDAMRGYWIVEMEEMSVARKSDADTLKAFLTRRVDRVRLPYERNSRDFPRRCVFVGTINDAEYLRDSTGNRRFAPVAVGWIDLEGLDRDQIWAEAYASWNADPDHRRLKLPEIHWAAATAEQEKRRIVDPLEARFLEVIGKFAGQGFISTDAILLQAGLITDEDQRRGQRLLGNVLKRAGLKKDRRRVDGKTPRWGWIMPEEEIEL